MRTSNNTSAAPGGSQQPMPATAPRTDPRASGGSFTRMTDPYRGARPDQTPREPNRPAERRQ